MPTLLGIPSLFVSIKPLYLTEWKAGIISTLLDKFTKTLSEKRPLDDGTEEPESTLLWCYYYQAQHYYYLTQYQRALEFANKVIEQSPDLPEGHMFAARILKHLGDLKGAAEVQVSLIPL